MPVVVILPFILVVPLASVVKVLRLKLPFNMVLPALLIERLLALMVPDKVISPKLLLVKPAPLLRVIVVFPVPESSVTPGAIVMTALPGSLLASMTPLAVVSLPVNVKLPLSVVMLALTRILRPACKVIAPPFPPVLLVVMAVLTVISLLACNAMAVPVLVMLVISVVDMVLSALGMSAKVGGKVLESK